MFDGQGRIVDSNCSFVGKAKEMEEIQQLSIEQKLKLVEDLWDSIAIESTNLPVSDGQKTELDKRLAGVDLDGWDNINARDFLSELQARL